MEQLRIDRKQLGLRAKVRDRRHAEELPPLLHSRPGGSGDMDDDLLARIDAVLRADDDVESTTR